MEGDLQQKMEDNLPKKMEYNLKKMEENLKFNFFFNPTKKTTSKKWKTTSKEKRKTNFF